MCFFVDRSRVKTEGVSEVEAAIDKVFPAHDFRSDNDQGIKTVLHPVSDLATATAGTPPSSADRRRPTGPIMSGSRPRASTSGWGRTVNRRA